MRRTVMTALGGAVLLAGVAPPALASRPHGGSTHRHFTEVEAGTQLSTHANRFEDTYRIKTSPFGGGSVIRDAVLNGDSFPVSGKAVATSYYKDGRLIANETFTLGSPRLDGIGAVTGTGTCTSGTFTHQGETCTYAIKGSYDLITGQMFLTLTGTYTPSAKAKRSG